MSTLRHLDSKVHAHISHAVVFHAKKKKEHDNNSQLLNHAHWHHVCEVVILTPVGCTTARENLPTLLPGNSVEPLPSPKRSRETKNAQGLLRMGPHWILAPRRKCSIVMTASVSQVINSTERNFTSAMGFLVGMEFQG